MKALSRGAFDFITKPEGLTATESFEQMRRELAPRLRALAGQRAIRAVLQGAHSGGVASAPVETPQALPPEIELSQRMWRITEQTRPELILIGVSTGGPAALGLLLPELPANLGVPVLVVQHMPALFTRSLAENLDSRCVLRVREAVEGESLVANQVYIAPGGAQMKVAPAVSGGWQIRITDEPPENNCKPAVDALFRSVALHGANSLIAAVLLTGMGSDGTQGLRLLKRHRCFSIAQDEASCVVYGMPKSAVEAGLIDQVLSLDQIAPRLRQLCKV